MIIQKHNAEANLLNRRLEFLTILDDLVRSGTELTDLLDNPDFDRLVGEFRDVEEPADLIAGIKAIYAKPTRREKV